MLLPPNDVLFTLVKRREMVGGIQQFDICIVCALAEEAEAVINEFSARCKIRFNQAFSQIDGCEYQCATIRNKERKALAVLVTWMPFTGPVETANRVRSLLEEFHPRFVAMTGICAGYKEQVALGDLVAAAYAFHYEEGKVEADTNERGRFRPEWRTHSTAKRVVQYINHFAAWEPPVAEMKRTMIRRELQEAERPRCVVAPVASGMAVYVNNPFPRLLEHNRKALFLDQEVAAFYQTLSEFPDMYYLAVKGVCDYGDEDKSDGYHDYAARASAIYLLFFIREYVTDQTMPRREVEQNHSRAGPYAGREESLKKHPHQPASGEIKSEKLLPIRLLSTKRVGFAPMKKDTAGVLLLLLLLFTGSASASPSIQQSSLGISGTPNSQTITTKSQPPSSQTPYFLYRAPSGYVQALAWFPDSDHLAVASTSGSVQVWETSRQKPSFFYEDSPDSAILSVAWSPNEARIAFTDFGGTVQVWDTTTHKRLVVFTGHTGAVYAVAWSPNGRYLASAGDDGTIQVWDATTSKRLFTYIENPNAPSGIGAPDSIYAVAWSRDSKRIAVAARDGLIQIWEILTTQPPIQCEGHSGAVLDISWSPDAKRLASAGDDDTVQVWDVTQGKHLFTYSQHTKSVEAVAWSPNGAFIASASRDGTVQVWSIP
jgi:nucleoside phosphorylase